MKRGERLKLVLLRWLLGPVVALLVLDTLIGWWTSAHLAHGAYDRGLHEIAREVALHVHANGAEPHLDLSPAAERALQADQDDRLHVRVWDGQGRTLGGSGDLRPPDPQPPRDGRPNFRFGTVDGESVRIVTAWLPYEGAGAGQRVLVGVAETLNKRHRLTWEIVASLVAAQLVLIAMACLAVYWGVGRGLRPLDALGRALARRSHQDLSPLDAEHAPEEVRPLVEEVNALMERLGGALDAQNRFVADAAHQLKTPVAGLKAQVEVALGEDDPARVRHALAQAQLSAERLSRIVQQLLALARNEPGAAAAVRLQSLDLGAFALEICMEWAPHALRRAIDLGFEGPPRPATINADADRLRDLLNNLIDNAVRYSREGGRVTVRVEEQGGERILSVSDDGPTIPPSERKRVFERFHRLLGGEASGSGLGLAIVSEIAALHGARITLEDDPDGTGNTFTVHFPSSQSLPA